MSDTQKTTDLATILEDNAGIIFKLSLMYSNSKEEAEDLRQEMSYQVVKSFGGFKGDSKVSTWIYKVALFTALSHLKARKQRPVQVYDIPEISDSLVEQDRWQEVLAVLKQLPPVDRSLIFLYLEGKTYAEMADIMGISQSNIGVRLNRIKEKMKERLG